MLRDHLKTVGRACLVAALLCIDPAAMAQEQPVSAPEGPDVPQTLAGRSFLSIPGERWKLVWHDEFTGERLDAGKWTSGLSWGGTDGTRRHHNDQYASYIADENVVLTDGFLELLTRRQDVTDAKGKVHHYTQAFVQTDGKLNYTYGYCEVRLKVPTEAGPGLWPAFWMLSKGWPPEDDVAEFWTGRPKPHTHQGYAFGKPDGKVGWNSRHEDAVPEGFHTYGLEWGPGYKIYNRDDRVTLRVHGAHVNDSPMYLILNSGVASKPAPPPGTVFPNAFVVDYVRVYERPAVVSLHNGGFEHDEPTPWTAWNGAKVVEDRARTGARALRLASGPASAEQVLYGLEPGTRYRLTATIDPAGDGEVRLGVKRHGREEQWTTADGDGYRAVTLDFTTGPDARTATVYCFKPSGAGAAYADDVAVSEPAL